MNADEIALPFRHPEELEHFDLVDKMAADAMRTALGLQPEMTYVRSWVNFASDEGPSHTNCHEDRAPFDIEHMRAEAKRGHRRFSFPALTT